MKKIIRGFCPVRKQEYSIAVDYLDIPTLDQGSWYKKGLFDCEYNAFGDECYVSKCPIMLSAPETIRERK